MPAAELIVSGTLGFAALLRDIWARLTERNDRRLDRDHQASLQAERFSFEVALARARSDAERLAPRVTTNSIHEAPLSSTRERLMQRLEMEARALHGIGFLPVFESHGSGFGLALLIGTDDALAFWLPPDFPTTPPQILLKIGDTMEEVTFDGATWSSHNFLLADIIEALQSTFTGGSIDE